MQRDVTARAANEVEDEEQHLLSLQNTGAEARERLAGCAGERRGRGPEPDPALSAVACPARLGAPGQSQTLSVHCDKNGTQLSEIEHALKVQIIKDQGATCFVSYLSVRQAGTHTLGRPRNKRCT